MEEEILLGRDREILEIPQTPRLNFMTDAHHQIRYFVVKEMVIRQKPIEPELISEELNIPLKRVNFLLEE